MGVLLHGDANHPKSCTSAAWLGANVEEVAGRLSQYGQFWDARPKAPAGYLKPIYSKGGVMSANANSGVGGAASKAVRESLITRMFDRLAGYRSKQNSEESQS